MARNVAALPFIFQHVALMPDVHLGKGALVGSVIATREAIIPAAVGVDIGCGMNALPTPNLAHQLDGKLKQIRSAVESAIPTDFSENKDVEKVVSNWPRWSDFPQLHPGVQREVGKAIKQLGSLSGGNHSLEVCLDTENQVWFR